MFREIYTHNKVYPRDVDTCPDIFGSNTINPNNSYPNYKYLCVDSKTLDF